MSIYCNYIDFCVTRAQKWHCTDGLRLKSNNTNRIEWFKARYERCIDYKNMLTTLALTNEKVTKFNDINGNEIIVYIRNFLTTMHKSLSSRKIKSKTYCEDLQIAFNISNEKAIGFLSQNSLIRTTSTEIKCRKVNQ